MDGGLGDSDEMVIREATESGNGAHIYVPKEWAGETVKATRVSGDTREFDWLTDRKIGDEAVIATEGENPESVDEVYLGSDGRAKLESAFANSDQLYIGYVETERSCRHVSIDKDTLSTHLLVPGMTGSGRSTLLQHLAWQLFAAGEGGIYFDLKGTSSQYFRETLPEQVLDDVVWISLGKEDQVNVFDLPDSTVNLGEKVEDYLHTVSQELATLPSDEGYWGPSMDNKLLEAVSSVVEKADGRPTMAMDDLFDAIGGTEKGIPLLTQLEQFSEEAPVELLWSENPTVNLPQAIYDNKPVVVSMEDVMAGKKGASSATLLRVIKAVRGLLDEPDPFYIFADDFDPVVEYDNRFDDFTATARAASLPMIMSIQTFQRLSTEMVDAILANFGGQAVFSPTSEDDAIAVSDRTTFGIGEQLNISRYQFRLSTPESDAMSHTVDLYPSYPPRRTADIS